MKRAKYFLSRILMAFALISLGFALGKKHVKPVNEPIKETRVAESEHIDVYYMHATFRCATCNTIESMTKDLLNRSYSTYLALGQIQWKEVDFQENESLAKQFDVLASCVVVANVKDGEVREFKRLDNVWTLMDTPVEFDKYICKTIDEFLVSKGPGS